ncbi:ABC transporter ATP-binding protein [Cohnella algarum]|uniref:ABC transporter ATP-binding protein n=1 Tax=Cohnella algarum TaxID=2044859 RepID=UPI001967318D|nr:ABC transporter ATP-binding protein [Cohnella algarum]MBN2980808.1 ABC transporter ATP-binding protein [Cohnella algarum]
MKWMFSYLKPYRAAVVLAPLLMILEVCMDLMQPRLMAGIVNDGILKGNLEHVWQTGGWMLAAAAAGLIGGAGCTYYSVRASMGFATDLRDALFQKSQTFTFRNLDRFTSGSLITRLTGDVVQVQNLVQIILRMLIRSLFLFLGSIVMALAISPSLSLLLAAAVPVLFAFLYVLLRLSVPLYRDVQKKLDRVNTVLQENLAGIRVVKAFVRERFENSRFRKANEEHYGMSVRAGRLLAVNMPFMTLALNLCIVAALWLGGAQTWEGGLEVGSLAAFLTYTTQALMSMLSLGNTLVNISRAKASAERIDEVLRTVPDMAEPEADRSRSAESEEKAGAAASPVSNGPRPIRVAPGRIEFDNVVFRYQASEGEPELQGICLTIEPGQTVGILGSTGSGKSTLVSLLPRLYDPTEGRVLIGGVDVRDIPSDRLRQEVGIVLQQAILFSGTIRDNIRFGRPDAAQEEVEAAARAAEAHDFICSFPEGYDTVIGQKGVNLSGGQKQRISIARALLAEPGILILDDSTSAVDLATEARIRRALSERLRGCTRLIIAQRVTSVMEADKIVVLEDGKIAAEGTHEQLLAGSAIYRDIYESQTGKEAIRHA